ncbi:Pogo transposable element [Aspergillus sclerotialis]|uniref:Pogo transposable element n=1 Tax=Aspergillus sclerotialis TaxID=2070753 RepID=A0A3A2Z7H5_9EURO|nr:Pogo transposable element [Aspergillus sclerotialis]
MANILLAERGRQTVGINWASNYIKRHDQLKTRYSRRYNYQRAKCEDPKVIRLWFDLVRRTIDENGIQPEDIYNFDETGFAMGIIATTKVVTRAEYYGRRSVLQPGNREWVTSIECVNSTGFVLPPCIIFKSTIYHQQAWYDDLPDDWRIEISQNGWTTDEIGLRWLEKLFIPITTSRTRGKYRLLVLDGHGSHLTPRFDRLCYENDIIPICMPPHSSHLLQPLDIGCFAPLKRAYGGIIEAKTRCNINHIDKLDFLAAFPKARTEAFKPVTIQNAFAAAGLVPYNPDRVISTLNIQLRTPTPPGTRPGSQSSAWSPKTPHNLKSLSRQALSIKRRLRSPSIPTERALNQLVKGCQLAMNSATILAKENRDLRAENETRKQKRKRSNKRISCAEGLSTQEARELINSPNQATEALNAIPTGLDTAASQPIRRAPPRCSDCNQVGHKRTHCPNRSDR